MLKFAKLKVWKVDVGRSCIGRVDRVGVGGNAKFGRRNVFDLEKCGEGCEGGDGSSEGVEASSTGLLSEYVFRERRAFYESYVGRMGEEYPCAESRVKAMSIPEFFQKFSGLKKGEKLREEEGIVFFGRVMNKRRVGKRLVFYKIKQNCDDVQLMSDFEDYQSQSPPSAFESEFEEFEFIHNGIRRGDIVSVSGYPYRTKTGQLTLAIRQCRILAPCLQYFPDYNSVSDKNLRYRYRHVDLMTSSGVKEIFVTRARIIRAIREYLDQRGFIEVETPILSSNSGGASAKPFKTYMESHNAKLYLRIAPELYLKQLVVGGMEKVYELGKSFRNESADLTHNPEFTMCEFYQAYADYQDLMDLTQEILRYIIKNVNPSKHGNSNYKILVDVPAKGEHEKRSNFEIDFSKPFRRINVVEELEKILGRALPSLNDPMGLQIFEQILKEYNLQYPPSPLPMTASKIFDFLVEHFLENKCIEPTFLCDFPVESAPLARRHRHKHGLTERFELFIARMELVNSYTELNNPTEQRQRFRNQTANGKLKKNEDWYCSTLEWGLPPTAGWGMGIDRLTMLLTNKFSIREVILFPFMKSNEPSHNCTLPNRHRGEDDDS